MRRLRQAGRLFSAIALTLACTPASDTPDQVGTYAEIYNASGEQLCPATVDYVDAFIEHTFEVLGDEPPAQRFVGVRWNEVSFGGSARPDGDRVRIDAGSPALESALVSAVHFETWPRGPFFLEAGLAMVLGNVQSHRDTGSYRPVGAELDEALWDPMGELNFHVVWVVVSSIVAERGFAGLERFWRELDPSSSMAQVRETYARLFGGSFDELTQPFEVVVDGQTGDVRRDICWVTACIGEPLRWDGDTVEALGVSGCTDDEAVSPSHGNGEYLVWRSYVVDEGYPTLAESTEGVYVGIEPCGVLTCNQVTKRDFGLVELVEEPWEEKGGYLVQVATDPEILTPGTEPTFTLRRQ